MERSDWSDGEVMNDVQRMLAVMQMSLDHFQHRGSSVRLSEEDDSKMGLMAETLKRVTETDSSDEGDGDDHEDRDADGDEDEDGDVLITKTRGESEEVDDFERLKSVNKRPVRVVRLWKAKYAKGLRYQSVNLV